MPWSKVVKSALSANVNVKGFALKDMVVEAESNAKAEEERCLGAEKERQAVYEEGVAFGAQQGYQKGFQEGYAKGFQEGGDTGRAVKEEEIAEYDKTTQLLLTIVSGLEHLTKKIEAESEKNILTLSIAVARVILKKEISEDSEVILKFVTEGLKSLGPVETASIRINPHDFEFLSRKSSALLQAIEGVKSLQFEQDARLLPGDVIVESKERSIDMRSASQVAMIERHLLQKSDRGT